MSDVKVFDIEQTVTDADVLSPNTKITPVSQSVSERGHLLIAGLDTVDLADKYGTPLYLMDEATIRAAVTACQAGLDDYPKSEVVYAGKAFLCLAICHLLKTLDVSLDVVSEGELHTAIKSEFPADRLLMHGNNKSPKEIETALTYGDVRIVVDSRSELEMVAAIARRIGKKARVLVRLIPGVAADTHHNIQTGHDTSKFGVPLVELNEFITYVQKYKLELALVGLHVHIGSHIQEMKPFLQTIEVVTDVLAKIKAEHNLEFEYIDLGGGVAIAYLEENHPISLFNWARQTGQALLAALAKRGLLAPRLMIEPGRAIVGTAGVTLYKVGHLKTHPDGARYIAVDGGMADNPRPITYQARYTAALANRMNAEPSVDPAHLVGKYCEQGDIIIEETHIAARSGDIVAVYGTGAYNYSMASNYNRTARPACLLLADGKADIIVERETNDDLLNKDRVPDRLLKGI